MTRPFHTIYSGDRRNAVMVTRDGSHDGIKSSAYTAECGCYASIGRSGGSIVLCDEHAANGLH